MFPASSLLMAFAKFLFQPYFLTANPQVNEVEQLLRSLFSTSPMLSKFLYSGFDGRIFHFCIYT